MNMYPLTYLILELHLHACIVVKTLGKAHPALSRGFELDDNDKHRRLKILAARAMDILNRGNSSHSRALAWL